MKNVVPANVSWKFNLLSYVADVLEELRGHKNLGRNFEHCAEALPAFRAEREPGLRLD
jgi:hypothetical protein